MMKMQQPRLRDLEVLQEVMGRADLGGIFLEGQESKIWSEPDLDDLVAIRSRKNGDTFSHWAEEKFLSWLYSRTSKSAKVFAFQFYTRKALTRSTRM